MESAEGAALGAAIQALHAATPGASLDALAAHCSPVREGTRLESRRADFYAGLLDRQNSLREKIMPR